MYVSSANISEDDTLEEIALKLRTALEENRKDDIRTGVTTVGAHRDDIEILINGKNARSFASQGQQRSAVLSLKLAEASVLREKNGRRTRNFTRRRFKRARLRKAGFFA